MKRLYRTEGRDATICGVCGGIAEYFGIDPTLVRVATAILIFAACPCGYISSPLSSSPKRAPSILATERRQAKRDWRKSDGSPDNVHGGRRDPAAEQGIVFWDHLRDPGETPGSLARFSQNRLCSRIARSCSPCSRLSPARSWYSSANAVSVVSSPARRYACSRCCSAR